MKGQISIDYYVALIIFIFFVVYFLFQISNLVPQFIGQMEEQRMRSEAYQLSELLVNDIGRPSNWNALVPSSTGQIERVGLSDQSRNKTNLVSAAKVAALNSLCASQGQQFLRTKLVTDLQFSVFVVDRTDGSTDVDCEPVTPNLRGFSVTTRRVVAFNDGRFGELTIQVWKP